jgi:hypothetical protein
MRADEDLSGNAKEENSKALAQIKEKLRNVSISGSAGH